MLPIIQQFPWEEVLLLSAFSFLRQLECLIHLIVVNLHQELNVDMLLHLAELHRHIALDHLQTDYTVLKGIR